MRFALLGNHPDGLSMACALTASRRHELIVYSGPKAGADLLQERGVAVKPVGDLEEILADPAVEAVIVAGRLAERAHQLRRALQSERHVLCVHPADTTPDSAYEAAMIQGDTRQVLLPLLPEALIPGLAQLKSTLPALGPLRLVVMDFGHLPAPETGSLETTPTLPGWNILRAVLGEIPEVSAYAVREEWMAGEPLVVAGRSETGVLFQASYLLEPKEPRWRVRFAGRDGQALLTLPAGWPGDVHLHGPLTEGETNQSRDWPAWDPWPALLEVFESAVLANQRRSAPAPSGTPPSALRSPPLTWQNEVRCLELDDAVRRSVERRRASTLEYQEASEEVGFKGTMTLVGCALLWSLLLLTILAVWQRWVLYLVIPVLFVFLGLQLLRWVIPRREEPPKPEGPT
jgi:predicted dehydrogenase